MRRFNWLFVTTALVFATPAFAGDAKPAVKKIATKKPVVAKKPVKKKLTPVSEAHKKKLAELYGGYKFGMTKDEVVAVLSKQLNESYEEKIKATTDIPLQDRLRKEKKTELARINATYVAFDGKKSGWDVSIVEDEFAHNTGESMLERWENKDGKNQRRFFFFHEGKLYKMFVSLDVSILPAEKKNFETFSSVMRGQYGPGDVETGTISWRTTEFEARAVDKLKTYDALGLVIEQPSVKKDLAALRVTKAPPKKEGSAVIKAVVDKDGTDKPDVKSNGGAVDDIIKSQGGSTKKN
ncbi:MAG: hypothetical protein WKG01_22710 [Kofleriaceae bacterium]